MIQIKIEKRGIIFEAIGNDVGQVKGYAFSIQKALENYSEHFKLLYQVPLVDYRWR